MNYIRLYRHSDGLVEVDRCLYAVTGCEICVHPSGTITQRYRIYDTGDTRWNSAWTPVQQTGVKKTRVTHWVKHFLSQGFEVQPKEVAR
jgi:hypothetical protein